MPFNPRVRSSFRKISPDEERPTIKGVAYFVLCAEDHMIIVTGEEEVGRTYLVEPLRQPDGRLGLRFSVKFRNPTPSVVTKGRRGKEAVDEKIPVGERSLCEGLRSGRRPSDVA